MPSLARELLIVRSATCVGCGRDAAADWRARAAARCACPTGPPLREAMMPPPPRAPPPPPPPRHDWMEA